MNSSTALGSRRIRNLSVLTQFSVLTQRRSGHDAVERLGVIWLKKEKVAVWDSFKINSLQAFFV